MNNNNDNQNKDVLFVVTKLTPTETGGELYNRKIYEYLESDNWNVSLSTEQDIRPRLRRAPFCWFHYLKAVFKLKSPSILLISGGLEQRLLLMMIWAKLFTHHRIVYISHLVYNYKKSWLSRQLYELIYRISYGCSNLIIANSMLAAEELKRQGAREEILRVIYPGVKDISQSEPSPIPLADCHEVTRLLAVGFLEPRKGYHHLLDAVVQIDFPFHLTIVGSLAVQPEYARQLEKRVQNDRLSGKVEFTGYLPHEEVMQLMSESDIFIQTSKAEGFGIAAFEAAGMGKAITGFLTPVFAELFHNGKDALFAEMGDIDGLRDNLTRLIKDYKLRTSLGNQARTLKISRRTWLDACNEIEQILLSQ